MRKTANAIPRMVTRSRTRSCSMFLSASFIVSVRSRSSERSERELPDPCHLCPARSGVNDEIQQLLRRYTADLANRNVRFITVSLAPRTRILQTFMQNSWEFSRRQSKFFPALLSKVMNLRAN